MTNKEINNLSQKLRVARDYANLIHNHNVQSALIAIIEAINVLENGAINILKNDVTREAE